MRTGTPAPRPLAGAPHALTDRQRVVERLSIEGDTGPQIARALGISVHAVRRDRESTWTPAGAGDNWLTSVFGFLLKEGKDP